MGDRESLESTSDGSYPALEKALREQIGREPELLLARVMLLELYFGAGRRDAFMSEARRLQRRIADPATSLEWQRCASMGRLLDPKSELFRQASPDLLHAAEAAAAAAGIKARRFGEQDAYAACFSQLADGYAEALRDRQFLPELDYELLHAAGRPSPLQHLRNLSERIGGAQIFLKREDLSPPNTFSVLTVAGQALLARRIGCKALVTSTVNGSRGIAAASIAAQLGLNCVVYMDSRDSKRYMREVLRMSLMEADLQLVSVEGLRNRDIREAAIAHWAENPAVSFMITGLDAVPEPYPSMLRDFASVIGRECKRQVRALAHRAPDVVVARGHACTDALGLMPPFVSDRTVRMACVDLAPGSGLAVDSFDDDSYEVSGLAALERRLAPEAIEGLRHPNVEREHAWLRGTGRVEYLTVTEEQVRQVFVEVARLEGIIPSLGSVVPLAFACEEARRRDPKQAIVVMASQPAEGNDDDIARMFGGDHAMGSDFTVR